MCKQDHQIRPADPVFHAGFVLAEDLGVTSVFPAQIQIIALHTFISADDDNAHTDPPLYVSGEMDGISIN
jgi:hypothetical protein